MAGVCNTRPNTSPPVQGATGRLASNRQFTPPSQKGLAGGFAASVQVRRLRPASCTSISNGIPNLHKCNQLSRKECRGMFWSGALQDLLSATDQPIAQCRTFGQISMARMSFDSFYIAGTLAARLLRHIDSCNGTRQTAALARSLFEPRHS